MVISVEECIEEAISAHFDSTGHIKLKRAPTTVELPKNSEGLRRRIKILGVSFKLAYKHSGRLWLSTFSAQVWQAHVDLC